MKKCLLKTVFVALLVGVALSPAFCGWDAFKNSSPDSSNGTLTLEMTEKSEPTTTEQPMTSSAEAVPDAKTTEELLEKSSESSSAYDEALEDTKDAIVEVKAVVEEEGVPEKVDAIQYLEEKVDDLIVSKAVLDEDQELLEAIVQRQTKALEKAERKMDGINYAVGLSIGHGLNFNVNAKEWFSEFSPGILFKVRYRNWEVLMDTIFRFDFSGGMMNGFDTFSGRNVEMRVGVLYEF